LAVIGRSVVCVGAIVLAVVVAPLLRADGYRADKTCPRPNSALDILWVHEPVVATCTKTIKVGHHLTPTETVSVETNKQSGASGTFEFATPHFENCVEVPGGSDQLAPRNTVALRHLTGVTTCTRQPGDTSTIQLGPYTLGGVPAGPFMVSGGDVLTFTVGPDSISVAVTAGTAHVDGMTVSAGKGWNWSPVQPAVRTFTPTALQVRSIAEAEYNILPATESELTPYLTQTGQSAFVIGTDPDSLAKESQLLMNSGVNVVGAVSSFDPNTIAVVYKQALVRDGGVIPTIVAAGGSTVPNTTYQVIGSVLQSLGLVRVSQVQAPSFLVQAAANTAAVTTTTTPASTAAVTTTTAPGGGATPTNPPQG
jgi:hypothetical protein